MAGANDMLLYVELFIEIIKICMYIFPFFIHDCLSVIQDMAELLLESGADIDQRNSHRQTPLFSAIEGQHRAVAYVCFLLYGILLYIYLDQTHILQHNVS